MEYFVMTSLIKQPFSECTMRKIPNNIPHQKGQSLMELAISVMVLLIILAGMIDLGRAIFYYLAMRDAAEEGMVLATINPSWCGQIRQAVQSNMDNSSIDVVINYSTTVGGAANTLCESADVHQQCAGHTVDVSVRDDNFPITMPLIGGFLGTQHLSLRANIQGTVIRPECP
jgi:hypothetical protein